MTADYTQRLRSHMAQVSIPSFRALARAADLSDWQIDQLRAGKAAQMRVAVLHRLSRVLQTPLGELVASFSDVEVDADLGADGSIAPGLAKNQAVMSDDTQPSLVVLQQEYQRLQAQLAQQREILRHDFQRQSLDCLESWMRYYPTAAQAAQDNPHMVARQILPLMRPIEQLLQSWGVEAIAPVGAELPYNPQDHELIDGEAQPGDRVKVRHVGYRQRDTLLFRAKVSPV